ncbi:hypothetical protein PENTCL1PPCAC_6540 [Pristionchus entomophagus]|uniref:Zinc metalloproteinase n=1 Tax=Pristionchus entomophagus TaxID=358040 RepID=A0AAV5SMZ7_9BILA|nr:hypothetical protein PENTCL1PPCAC_6540 [Pristionchus entomophagus]
MILLILPLFLSCPSLAEKTLRSFVSRSSLINDLNRLSEQVDELYGKNEIQLDTLKQPPFTDDSPFRIQHLNSKYSDILFEGDIRVSPFHLRRLIRRQRNRRQAIKGWSNKWPNGIVPYSLHTSINSYKKNAIEEAISFWQRETCIDFIRRTTEGVYLHFVGHDDGCWSTVGRDPAQKEQWISIGNGCEPLGISSHEIAHSLGLFHEQSRYDRDDHVTLISSRVPRSLLYNFAKASAREISTYNLPYDVGSVMHYSPVEFTNEAGQPSLVARDANMQQTMGSLEGPSFLDIQIMNTHYRCEKKCKNRIKCKNRGFIDSRDCNKCKCPTGFGGTLCEKDDYGDTPGCGGEAIAEEKEKELSFTVLEGKNCFYHIKAPLGRKISVTLKSVKGRCEHGCGRDRVEFKINPDPRPIGYRFCCPEEGSRRFTSHSSSLPVLLSSTISSSSVKIIYRLN